MEDVLEKVHASLGEYLPTIVARLREGDDMYTAIAGGMTALEQGSLSWARLNQILHRCSQAGISEGFFRYYFLEIPRKHPYPVERVLLAGRFRPPDGVTEIKSLQQLEWGIRRFMYDAMLYWGNFRQAFRDLRGCGHKKISKLFESKRIDAGRMTARGKVEVPKPIPQDYRYLISEMACKTYEEAASFEKAEHVKFAIDAFHQLRSENKVVTPALLKNRTEQLARGNRQLALFELMYEDAHSEIGSEAEVLALYSGQWQAFREARSAALENTRIYLSICNDLDVYVATSMRNRQDFRDMVNTCNQIFLSEALSKYNIRYFDPTLSAAGYHEDKGLIECLMVKTAKILLYFSQHKESLGKVSEYAMALSQGKPVIVLCPDDEGGREIYKFYRESHPLMRLVEFKSGTVNGAMITCKVPDVIMLLERIFSNSMEYDLERKPDTDAYYLLKERVTATTVRVISDDRLLTETFWNNWHGIY